MLCPPWDLGARRLVLVSLADGCRPALARLVIGWSDPGGELAFSHRVVAQHVGKPHGHMATWPILYRENNMKHYMKTFSYLICQTKC